MNIHSAQIHSMQRLAREFSSSMTTRQREKITQAGGIPVGKPNSDFIRAAMNAQGVNNSAVEAAKQMIASGELDTPENIFGAAENIMEYGI